MIFGLYHSAAGMMTSEYRQSVTANNLANADTTGFKRDIATFAEREPASVAGRRRGASDANLSTLSGGLWIGETHTDFADGPAVQTGNTTDVALEGAGFLMVQKEGETLLTRDGRFITDEDGRLRTASEGAEVLGVGGMPLRVTRNGEAISIDEDGVVFQGRRRVGQLALTDVSDYDQLEKAGDGCFRFDAEQTRPAEARVRQGFIESSGVEPIKEMVNMIDSSRAYQMNAQMLSLQDQSLGRLISVVS